MVNHMKKVIEYALSGGIMVMFLGFVVMTIVSANGPIHCRGDLLEAHTQLYENSVEVESVWARTTNNHWLSGFLMQPKDRIKSEFTIICHFKSTNYIFDHAAIYEGNRINQVKSMSVSNLNPKTWFKYLGIMWQKDLDGFIFSEGFTYWDFLKLT